MGKKKQNKVLTESAMRRQWRKTVLYVYNHRCFLCGLQGDSNLQCHHVIPHKRKVTRWDYRNGIALCALCHRKMHTMSGMYILFSKFKNIKYLLDKEPIVYLKFLKKNKISHSDYYQQQYDEMEQFLRD